MGHKINLRTSRAGRGLVYNFNMADPVISHDLHALKLHMKQCVAATIILD